MKVVIVGAAGSVGQGVVKLFKNEGHDVIQVNRSQGDVLMDIRDVGSLQKGFAQIGNVDAIIATMGEVVFKPFDMLTHEDWIQGFESKLLGQIQLTQIGSRYLNSEGSITLTSGIIADVLVKDGISAATINGALEHFISAVAVELPSKQRINIVSPTVLTESLTTYQGYFPGFVSIDASSLAQAYLRSALGRENGRILKAFSNHGVMSV
ncbi:short chain dehydrogenase [Vibrio cholerae]|uniref:short chain dehydrogenase n=1 Tax=Vibrio cholerae TaxID=666 RepID=UPI00115B7DFB|nr:short chain dehydrogenase [Vibrio cholerae]TQP06912.1 short chain dehydrogenase [Vibrio cholerae]TQP90466.1 short chain dehydrogenase [Vibrio cholerae]